MPRRASPWRVVSGSTRPAAVPLWPVYSEVCTWPDDRHLKVHIWKAAPPAERPVDLQHGLVVFVGDEEFRGEGVPLLEDVAHRVSRWRLDLQLCRMTVWGEILNLVCSPRHENLFSLTD